MLERVLKLTVVALLLASFTSAQAEWKNRTQSQGNNIGLTVSLTSGGPLDSKYYSLPPTQFPRGSGNMYKVGRWGWGVNVARDNDGDGVKEDTIANQSRAGHFGNQRNSLEYYDDLAAMAAAGERMGEAAGRLSSNRVWTTSDPDDVSDWPAEFREGRSASGEPIFHGAETIVAMLGNAFTESQDAVGASIEHRFHFLNFAESNDMVYCHVFFRNMSEYIKWNANPDVVDRVSGTPDGQVWNMQMTYSRANGVDIGGGDEAYAYYFPRNIIVNADRNGVEGSFTGHPAAICDMLFELPTWNGQQLEFKNTCAHAWTCEFGFCGVEEILESGYNDPASYRYGNGKDDPSAPYYPGELSPWTNGPLYGWPGVLEPGDERYEQWIWGYAGHNLYNFFSEFTDFAPRDSFSYDHVIAFVYPKDPPFAFPQTELAEIDNPEVQDQLSPILTYMTVAEVVRGGGYILPETPDPPPLTIIPGDKEVTVSWSDVNINTPDQYYYFLQDNPELDPNGVYREYDFEGYRLYRSFVGPSDSHSEMIYQCSLSDGNINFYYKDTNDSDEPYYRIDNGMHIWYALVPYDQNYDPQTGAMFSLPDPESGKIWNRPGSAPLYTVETRSNASNFRHAQLANQNFTYEGSAQIDAPSVELAGDGSGMLTEAPKWLVPQIGEVEYIPVNSERVSAHSVYIECSALGGVNWGGCNYPAGTRSMRVNRNGAGGYAKDMVVRNRGDDLEELTLNPPADAAGVDYALTVEFTSVDQGNWRSDTYDYWDPGSYTGATIEAARYRCGQRIGSAPNILGWTQEGQYTIQWVDAGDGMLTLSVHDDTRNVDVPFGPYMDDHGWGIAPNDGTIGDRWGGDNLFNDTRLYPNDKDARGNQMVSEIAADNTEEIGIYLAGIFWVFNDLTEMPAAGTTMTCTIVFGSWNDDQTVFTQYAPPPWPGDKWKVDIQGYTMNSEDADLSKVQVVPNPYMASSYLDLSPDNRRIEFVNLPDRCTIRIYSLGGHLVNVLNHIGSNRFGWGDYEDWDRLDAFGNPMEFEGYDNHSGTEPWNLRNRFGQTVASGLYFFHVTDSRGETHTGKFYIIN